MATRRLSKTPSFNTGRQSPKDDISVLESKYISMPEELFTTNLNLLNIEASLLSNIILAIFKRFIITVDYQKVSPLALKEFVIDVCDTYKDVPYHNLHHATNILHFTFIFLNKCDLFKKLNPDILFGCLIAALVHDIGHPGNNNSFEINTFSELAIKYNDLSVLEQYHCAIAFELIKKHKLHSLLTHNDFILFRKTIVATILGTDMSHHKSMTDLLEIKNTTGFNLTSTDEQILLCKMLVHAADIGNPIHITELYEEWSRLVACEFHNQILKEKELGLTPFSSFDISSDISFFSNEIGFITYVCLPYWKIFSDIYPELHEELERIKNNLQIFTEKLKFAELKNSIAFEKYT